MWRAAILMWLLAALPSSSNYQLNNYSLGNGGGTANSSSANFQVNGTAGEQTAGTTGSTTYQNQTGNNGTQQANVPQITLTNPSLFYNKLKFVLDQQNNPSDATFAIAISTDSGFSSLNYIQADDTIGASQVWQDYTTWGGATGQTVIGLVPNTTYYVKAKARQGNFTETGFGPSSSATTENPHLTFSLSTSSVNFSSLLPATVASASPTIDVTFSTNGDTGGNVYIQSQNGALVSASTSTPINSATADLASASHGYGAQVTATGLLTAVSPYNGAGSNVGLVNATSQSILSVTGPVTSGTASITMKAKAAITDAAANSYQDLLTLVAAARF